MSSADTMDAQWIWVLRLLAVFFLAPARVSRGVVIVRWGRLAVTAATLAWALLFTLSGYLLIWRIVENDNLGCFHDVIHKTMRVYNAKTVVTTVGVFAYMTNAFCLVKMYRRDLVNIIGQNVGLYAKAAGTFEVQPFALSMTLKSLIVFVFLSPFVVINVISILCESHSEQQWHAVLSSSFSCYLCLPVTCMVTVLFVLLYTVEGSLALLHKQLLTLYASKTPRPFLESSKSPPPETTSRTSLTAHKLYALRMVHCELVEFMEDVMKQFQADILVLFLTSFCQCVMFTYSSVFNHRDMFKDRKTFFYVCQSLFLTVHLVASLWMICAGPVRVKDKQEDLMNSTARLSTILNQPSDVLYEIRIFQLQVRNHTPSFEVFGMFQLSFSLLFRMCASIISYIVVLIQFAVPPEDVESI